jgi:exopolyphosphatase/guanosine-5'-triphosphate,3'-diphosphate pyrophosphatase
LLEAAAYLHDTGHFISDTAHHKHSAYIVANADLAGFTDRERVLISQLCRFHRKTMPAARHDSFQALSAEEQRRVLLLVPLLRLADSLDRSHRQGVGEIECKVEADRVVLTVTGGSQADLEVWAAERVADVFAQVYGRALELASGRSV